MTDIIKKISEKSNDDKFVSAVSTLIEKLEESKIMYLFVGSTALQSYLPYCSRIPSDIDILIKFEEINKFKKTFPNCIELKGYMKMDIEKIKVHIITECFEILCYNKEISYFDINLSELFKSPRKKSLLFMTQTEKISLKVPRLEYLIPLSIIKPLNTNSINDLIKILGKNTFNKKSMLKFISTDINLKHILIHRLKKISEINNQNYCNFESFETISELIIKLEEKEINNSVSVKKVAELYKYIYKLKHLRRTGWIMHDIENSESVAEHIFAMAFLAILLIDERKYDLKKVLISIIIHEISEAIIGDITPFDNISVKEKHQKEEDIAKNILNYLDETGELFNIWEEFELKTTKEGKIVKDIDRFELILQANTYEEIHNKDLSEFYLRAIDKIENTTIKNLAKKIYNDELSLTLTLW